MKEEKILTKHPLGRSGKNIDKQKYETLKKGDPICFAKERTHSHRIIRSAEQELKWQVLQEYQLVCGNY